MIVPNNGLEAATKPEAAPRRATTAKQVFLSYASSDKNRALELCLLLEEQCIACWIAPRDVIPGSDYAEAIIRAIESTATIVLLLSASSNASVHVRHEVERATSKGKRVIPVRLENISPGPALELHLSSAHWLDAWHLSPEQTAAQLVLALKNDRPASHPPASLVRPRQPRRWMLLIGLPTTALIVAALCYTLWPNGTSPLEDLRVKSFRIHHFAKTSEETATAEGVLGEQSFGAHVGDQVTLDVELSRPAYAYLVAFRPDGVMELISPDTEDQPPVLSDRIRYPASDQLDQHYGLQEGAGLWVFAVAASDRPLPPFKRWAEEKPTAWVPTPSPNGNVFVHDGTWIDSKSAHGTTRAKGEAALGVLGRFVNVMQYLKGRSSATVAAGNGFAVATKK